MTSEPSLRLSGSLEQHLREAAEEIGRRRGMEEARALFDGQIDPATAAAANILRQGEIAPDFTLTDTHGFPITLSNLLTEARVVLVFYRGPWCPFCNLQLRALAQHIGAIGHAGARLVAVSPAAPEKDASPDELPFPVLWDALNAVARSYGLLFEVSETARELLLKRSLDLDFISKGAGWELPVPATFIIGRDRTIIEVVADADYRNRPEPGRIVASLQETR